MILFTVCGDLGLHPQVTWQFKIEVIKWRRLLLLLARGTSSKAVESIIGKGIISESS